MNKILIIEDDTQLAKLYKTAFEQESLDVNLAATAAEAFQIIKDNQPNVIILDIMLGGGLNGFDVLEQLKRSQKTSRIPIIVLTNLDSERKTALAIGADDYIIKSETTLSQVVEKIKSYLN